MNLNIKFNEEQLRIYSHQVAVGLVFGVFMFLLNALILPYFFGYEITWRSLLMIAVFCTLGGLGFGYTMKLLSQKK